LRSVFERWPGRFRSQAHPTPAIHALPYLISCIRIADFGPIGLGRSRFRIAAGDTFPAHLQAASAFTAASVALTSPPATAPPRRINRPNEAPQANSHDRDRCNPPAGVIDPPLLRFSSLQHTSTAALASCSKAASLRTLASARCGKRCCSRRRDAFGVGRSVTFQITR
jgi:hypothetical protein